MVYDKPLPTGENFVTLVKLITFVVDLRLTLRLTRTFFQVLGVLTRRPQTPGVPTGESSGRPRKGAGRTKFLGVTLTTRACRDLLAS